MDDKEKLDKILELAEDTNKLVHKMRRVQVFSGLWTIFYWVIVIGIGIGAFYYIQIYIDSIKEAVGIVSEKNASSSPLLNFSFSALKDLVK